VSPEPADEAWVERVATGVEAVVLPADRSSFLSAEGLPVRAYVVGAPDGKTDDVLLVDAGYAAASSVEAIARAVGGRRVRAILLTHAHPDHGGGAVELAARFAAPVRLSPAETRSWGADARLAALATPIATGDAVGIPGRRLVAVAAAGHTRSHLVYHDPAAGLLFSGDTVLGEGTVMVGPPDGDMVAYLATLARLAALEPLERILPGHGPPVEKPRVRIEQYVRHRRMREAQVVALLEAAPRTPDEVVAALYEGAVAPDLLPLARVSALGQLEKLVAEGRVRRDGERFVLRGDRPS
jgi:glyoxylase-like metal-dependent hydrolase (beta-lactamase superfamily II)